jgi:hypothetical protein
MFVRAALTPASACFSQSKIFEIRLDTAAVGVPSAPRASATSQPPTQLT